MTDAKCFACNGTGTVDDFGQQRCLACGGTGRRIAMPTSSSATWNNDDGPTPETDTGGFDLSTLEGFRLNDDDRRKAIWIVARLEGRAQATRMKQFLEGKATDERDKSFWDLLVEVLTESLIDLREGRGPK